MLFTARSPGFIHAPHELASDSVAVLHPSANSVVRPWLVATYLSTDAANASWETVCALHVFDMVDHVKAVRGAQIAELLYMQPPRPTSRFKWSKHVIRSIEQGEYNGVQVTIYTDDRCEQHCFDQPDVDPRDVGRRRSLLRVQPYRHFD